MANEQKPPRKKVLYVDQPYASGLGLQSFSLIRKVLSEKYDLTTQNGLDHWIVGYIKGMSNNPFNALITHLPYDPEEGRRAIEEGNWAWPSVISSRIGYSRSTQIVRDIKEGSPDLPIMLYTGAANSYLFSGGVVDLVVEKTRDSVADLRNIQQGLEYFFNCWPAEVKRRRERLTIPPNIIKQDGKTMVDVVVNSKDGIDLTMIGKILITCTKYNSRVTAIAQDGERANFRDALGILGLTAYSETPLRIVLDGQGENEDKLIKKLYSILISPDNDHIEEDRFL